MTTLGQNFPLYSNRIVEIELILTAFGSILEDRSAYYLSVPITSGKRYIEMRHLLGSGGGSREDSDNLRAQLIQISRVQTEPIRWRNDSSLAIQPNSVVLLELPRVASATRGDQSTRRSQPLLKAKWRSRSRRRSLLGNKVRIQRTSKIAG